MLIKIIKTMRSVNKTSTFFSLILLLIFLPTIAPIRPQQIIPANKNISTCGTDCSINVFKKLAPCEKKIIYNAHIALIMVYVVLIEHLQIVIIVLYKN